MPDFSISSQERLSQCDLRLQKICNEVIKYFDFTIVDGYRNKEKQNNLFYSGQSKLKYPHSKHNEFPSRAVDIAPYPINWNDKERFYLLAGMMFAVAEWQNIPIRWGGDWNKNWKFSDQSFHDLPHFELI
ncbi:M15 family metallopeptidase [Rickettsiales bacterium]|nr:M15 family metallopeptidase [Rickettsiales bacterium]